MQRGILTHRLTASVVLLSVMIAIEAQGQSLLDTSFTYQGQLKLSGESVNDTADFEFTLWQDADSMNPNDQIGDVFPAHAVNVGDGLFTVELDFGCEAFDGDARWLEIAVRSPAGSGEFTTLAPRQPLTATPYALQTRGLFVDGDGYVGIGTTPETPFHVVSNDSSNSSGESGIGSITCVNTRPIDDTPAISGRHDVTDFWGVGVQGIGGYTGVLGKVRASGDQGYFGVYGNVTGGTGWDYGVFGTATGSGTNYGVYGTASGGNTNYAGYFNGDVKITSELFVGNVPYGNYGNAQWNSSTGQLCYDNSSRRYKENITPLEDDFDKLLRAVPMTYTRPGAPDRWEIGFIAEEFAELELDRLLFLDDEGEPFGVNYSKIPLYLNEIVKGHRARLDAKDAEIAELRSRVDKLEALVAEMIKNK